MEVDILDITVLVIVLVGTLAYFTKGSLWGASKSSQGTDGVNSGSDAKSRDLVERLETAGKNTIIFYGSQTGTAEDYASRLAKEASSRFGLKSMAADVEEYDFENLDTLPSDKIVGFVMATYGEGEPTDNAINFYEFITSEFVSFSGGGDIDSEPLKNLNYVIFGLGNNTYEHFNAIARNLDKALQRLGAHKIGPYGEGDDGAGTMEEDYISWKDEMFESLKAERSLEEFEAVYEPSLNVVEKANDDVDEEEVYLGEPTANHLHNINKGPYGPTNPYLAKVVKSRELFNANDRNCIHLELDIAGSGCNYTTGDHLALWTQNSNEEIARFMAVFGLTSKSNHVIDVKTIDPTAKVPFAVPTTYDTVVRYYLEINGPVSRQFLSSIAAFAPDEQSKSAAQKLGNDKESFLEKVTKRYYNTARLLDELSKGKKWSKVPFAFIIESLQHLQPRYYSISSSSLVDPHVISITAVVESIKPSGADHILKGVATNYILDISKSLCGTSDAVGYNISGPRGKFMSEGEIKVPIHIRHSAFKLPSNPNKPIILIGPGTGVAPFRGFIHDRAFKANQNIPVGASFLFFGSRNPSEDFLYGDEWSDFGAIDPIKDDNDYELKNLRADNFLTVFTAFSRVSDKKVYVQDRLLEHSKLINKAIVDCAYVYVCGDAMRMAREVQATLAKIISVEQKISLAEAERKVSKMKTENSYQEDVW